MMISFLRDKWILSTMYQVSVLVNAEYKVLQQNHLQVFYAALV